MAKPQPYYDTYQLDNFSSFEDLAKDTAFRIIVALDAHDIAFEVAKFAAKMSIRERYTQENLFPHLAGEELDDLVERLTTEALNEYYSMQGVSNG